MDGRNLLVQLDLILVKMKTFDFKICWQINSLFFNFNLYETTIRSETNFNFGECEHYYIFKYIKLYNNGNIGLTDELNETKDNLDLVYDGGIDCIDFIENVSLPGDVKHKFYSDGSIQISGELIEGHEV